MSDHKSIDQLRSELGVITFGNQHFYSKCLASQSIWSEREALEWIKIFADDDYDDYGALAWDIVLLVERQISTEGISELTKIENYWAQIALQSLSPKIQSAETD